AAWVAFIAAQTGKKVDYVDMRQPQTIWVQDGDLRLKIGVADSTLTRRLGRLASTVPALDKVDGQLDYIDLALDNNIPLKVSKIDPKHPAQKAQTMTLSHGDSSQQQPSETTAINAL